jgi:hypothetical protein
MSSFSLQLSSAFSTLSLSFFYLRTFVCLWIQFCCPLLNPFLSFKPLTEPSVTFPLLTFCTLHSLSLTFLQLLHVTPSSSQDPVWAFLCLSDFSLILDLVFNIIVIIPTSFPLLVASLSTFQAFVGTIHYHLYIFQHPSNVLSVTFRGLQSLSGLFCIPFCTFSI